MNFIKIILALVVAFFCGAIPTAYLLGKLKGIDIRLQGSGNVGATNAFRVLGTTLGVVCLIIDILKGWLPTYLLLPAEIFAPILPLDGWQWAVGIAAIAGHMFSPFLHFKGGKGVATSLGVMLAIAPLAVGIVFVAGLIIIAVWGYVSAASIAGAALLPILILLLGTQLVPRPFRAWTSFWVTLALGALIIWKHRGNLARLRAGTEKRIVRGLLNRPKQRKRR